MKVEQYSVVEVNYSNFQQILQLKPWQKIECQQYLFLERDDQYMQISCPWISSISYEQLAGSSISENSMQAQSKAQLNETFTYCDQKEVSSFQRDLAW